MTNRSNTPRRFSREGVPQPLSEAKAELIPPNLWLNPQASESTLSFLERAFGERIAPEEAVRRVIETVQVNGDEGIRELAHKFDGVELSALEVTQEEIARAYDSVDTHVIDALHKAAEEIEAFHVQQSRTGWMDFERGVGQLIRPVQRAGIYVPGGRAAYPSTVLMIGIPARVANVPEIFVTTPARANGVVAPVTLVACSIATNQQSVPRWRATRRRCVRARHGLRAPGGQDIRAG